MTIVAQNKFGWLVCHQKFLQDLYMNCLDSEVNCKSFRFRQEYFEINTPLLMTSAAMKEAEKIKNPTSGKKRKSKKKAATDISLYHSKVKAIIEEAVATLCEEARSIGYLKSATVTAAEWFDNNSAARQASKNVNCCYGVSESSQNRNKWEYEDVHFSYTGQKSIIININHKSYLVPPNSSYFLADIKDIHMLSDTRYDVVMIDPPWKNKSVKRRKGYMTLTNDELQGLPIQSITKPGSIILIWTTNNENQLSFVKQNLFCSWHIQHCADWHWVKITKKGMYTCSMDSPQKKPYENIIIGKVKLEQSDSENNVFESHKVIVSIPSSIHSHKPPMLDILKSYIPEGAKCLELFARSLLPDWTSYGNEVLKLQNLDLFERINV